MFPVWNCNLLENIGIYPKYLDRTVNCIVQDKLSDHIFKDGLAVSSTAHKVIRLRPIFRPSPTGKLGMHL